jgi:type I restriction enzyme, S subunit
VTAGYDGLTSVPLWVAVRSREEFGRPDLPLLTVISSSGVALRDLTDGRAPSDDLSGYRVVLPGDLVVNKLWARFGAYGVSTHAGIISPAYWVLSVDACKFYPPFLHHLLRSSRYLAEISRISKNLPPNGFDLPWVAFRNLKVPLLPLDEQRRIARFLDEQVSILDAAVVARRRQGALLTEQFMAQKERHIEQSETPLIALNRVIDPRRPINYGVLMPGPRLEEGIPLVEAGDVMRGPIEVDDLRRTDPEIESPFARSRLRSGDLVMAIRGSVGQVQEIRECPPVMNVTRDAARISVLPEIARTAFIRHALTTSRAQQWLELRVGGSAVTGINIGDLRKVPVRMPSIDGQCRLAQLLDAAELRQRQAAHALRASITLLAERKQALITAAVSGQFDVSTTGKVSVS